MRCRWCNGPIPPCSEFRCEIDRRKRFEERAGAWKTADCATKTCTAAATSRVHWPGNTVNLCEPCTRRANNIAAAMGFALTVDAIATDAEIEALANYRGPA